MVVVVVDTQDEGEGAEISFILAVEGDIMEDKMGTNNNTKEEEEAEEAVVATIKAIIRAMATSIKTDTAEAAGAEDIGEVEVVALPEEDVVARMAAEGEAEVGNLYLTTLKPFLSLKATLRRSHA